MRILIGALAVALLAGCSTSAVAPNEAVQAPKNQLTAFQTRPTGDFGEIQVIRDNGHTGSLCDIAIFVDGRQAGRLSPGQKASFYVQPGPLAIGVAYTGSGICGLGADRVEREASAKIGSVKRYRISTGGDGKLDVLPSTL